MRKRWSAVAAGVAAWVLVAGAAQAAVLCTKRSGVVVVRDAACKKKETALDPTPFIPAGGIGSGLLEDGGVGAADLGAGAVGAGAIADGAVGPDALADGAVSAAKLAPGVVPKVLSLNPYAAFLGGVAVFSSGYGPFAGIHLPDGANGSFGLGFTIPPNYTTGTPLAVRVLWHTNATGCDVLFRANSISVARPGRTHIVGVSTTDGLEVVGGETIGAPATAEETAATMVEITSPVAGIDLEPGDSVIFNLFRSGGAGSDTCAADVVVQSVRVEYQ
jgi:hypothetical protein